MSNPSYNLSQLDNELIQILRPVVSAQCHLYYPFFANTFPLAFHLMCANRTDSNGFRASITEVPWTKEPEELLSLDKADGEGPAICYATEEDCERLNHDLTSITWVWDYQPKYMFVDRSLNASAVLRTEGRSVSRVMLDKLLDHRKHFDLYTDIPEQATAICRAIGVPHGQQELHVAGVSASDRLDGPPPADCIRLYLYGGPLTAFLNGQPNKYEPVEIPKHLTVAVRSAFRTNVCISTKHDQVHDALKSYHERILKSAIQAKYDEFWAVQTAYNRYAEAQQLPAVFRSTVDYVDCFTRHTPAEEPDAQVAAKQLSAESDAGEIQTAQPIALQSNHGLRPFVLCGCGNEALGLIIPALLTERRALIVFVVSRLDKDGKPWPDKPWCDVVGNSSVYFPGSDGTTVPFEVVKGSDFRARAISIKPQDRLLVLADTWDVARAVIQSGAAVGTCLHKSGLEDFQKEMSKLPDDFTTRPLLLFENTVDRDVENALKGKFEVHQVVCDRIASNRQLGYTFVLSVQSEPFGELVVPEQHAAFFSEACIQEKCVGAPIDLGLSPRLLKRFGPFDGDDDPEPTIVLRPIRNEYFEVYKRRKRWLMNSIQYAYALLAIRSCIDRNISYEGMAMPLAEAVIDRAQNKDLRSSIDVYVECQILRMMLASERGDAKSDSLVFSLFPEASQLAIYQNLRTYADLTRGRINAVTDQIRRIVKSTTPEDKRQEFFASVSEFYDRAIWQRLTKLEVPVRFGPNDVKRALETLHSADVQLYADISRRRTRQAVVEEMRKLWEVLDSDARKKFLMEVGASGVQQLSSVRD